MRLYSNIIANNYSALKIFARKMSSQTSTVRPNRVLSIQSHVVHGYVGNKSATFPLQVLGFEVDAINSVQFSNHTGYSFIKGQVMNEKELMELFEGLKSNNLLSQYTHLLTGYIGNELFLRNIAEIVKSLREVNPNLIYVCDPVMGDEGHMYVPKTLLPIYRDEIIPLADIATPNQFEVELLTDMKIKTEDHAWTALQKLHEKGVKTVALSSSDLGSSEKLLAFLSHRSDSGNDSRYKLAMPRLGGKICFTGCGDLFASLFLAHSTLTNDVGQALENTTATLQSVIRKTISFIPDEVIQEKRKVTSMERELKLIQSKVDIESPKIEYHATKEIVKSN